jgi:16S rRNA (cytosine967-C5)-methyltransferase
MESVPVQERMITGLFLCSGSKSEMLLLANPDWNEKAELPIHEKLQMLHLKANDLFPCVDELSEEIDVETFCNSHFTQPDLFVRIRPGNKETVLQKLASAGMGYQMIHDDCIVLPNHTRLDDVLMLNKEAVVQDYSSQQAASFLDYARKELQTLRLRSGSPRHSALPVFVWDCCAASGGKSIMTKDVMGDVELTVSDVRESILVNLKKRFAEAGIKNYKSFVADLSSPLIMHHTSYDLIIADVPCSGSGTWGRTPEYLSSFSKEQITHYSQLQQKIVTNIIPRLSEHGYLLYITCSVYKKENEEMVNLLQQQYGLHLIEMKLLKGYEQKADSMFAALLKRS